MFNGFHYMNEATKSVKDMRTCVFHRDGVEYQVYFHPQRVWDDIIIYRIDSNRRIFKKKELIRYLQAVVELEAIAKYGFDRTADDYLYRIAEFALNGYFESIQKENRRKAMQNKQLEYLQKGD